VSTFSGSYSLNTGRFTTAEMPWFGNQSLATRFASAVGAGLGLTPGIVLPGVGPLFAASTGNLPFITSPVINNSLYYQVGAISGTYPFSPLPPLTVPQSGSLSALVPYAVAREVIAQSVPAPCRCSGPGAAFGFSRRLRSRIRRSTAVRGFRTPPGCPFNGWPINRLPAPP
jgi:hypothetical protein